ncbi:MAG TPA: glycosyltransferase [Methylomusa anaerophila]|nr:glycosyltransferase [Methylomusa anaerophila]HML88123.1 glycosyltransferase [Methylomusa anaerophila]
MPDSMEVKETNGPTIAVYGIYKNEEKFMERFLHSVQTADEIVLCDTGSNDNTNQIIKQFKACCPHVNIKVYSICVSPWRFDDARNTSLSLVSPDIDICISLDIDEYLMDGWKEHLRDHWEPGYTRYYHKFRTIWPAGNVSEHWHERIHIRAGYTWKLPVHEILEYKGEEKIKRLEDFWVYQKPDYKKSRSSYLLLLEQSVKERKDVWKSWSFLASEYLMAGRFEEALRAVDNALQLNNSDKSYLHKVKYFVYRAQNQMDLAILSLNNAIFYMPHRREPYFEKAMYFHQLGRNAEAYFILKGSEKITNKAIDYHYNPAAWDTEFERWKSQLLELAKEEGINFA